MLPVERIEPRVEARHARPTVELGHDRRAGERRDIQPRVSSPRVEIVRQADVASRHTHIIHIDVGLPSGGTSVHIRADPAASGRGWCAR